MSLFQANRNVKPLNGKLLNQVKSYIHYLILFLVYSVVIRESMSPGTYVMRSDKLPGYSGAAAKGPVGYTTKHVCMPWSDIYT